MIIDKVIFSEMINSPVRYLKGRVEVFEGSTLAFICDCHDNLKSFTVERVGEQGKFFGFGICQKINVHLLDPKRELNITTANNLKPEFGVDSEYICPCPNFYVTEVNRDENTNELSITAYDALYGAAGHTVSELALPASYTIGQFAEACAAFLGLSMNEVTDASFNTLYPIGANFEGTETFREALNAVAEATQTIYYLDKDNKLTFKRLDRDGEPVVTVDKEKYITLDSKTNRRLSTIVHATELGDNVSASLDASGSTQYVRDNPFWDMREDIADIVNNALAAIGGLTINQFECNWRGNFLLEIGDKIGFVTKDNKTVASYVLDDSYTFNGGLSGKTQWKYTDNDNETAANPTSLGEVLKQTYARVDKANKEIEMVASETSANSEEIGKLKISTQEIQASVSATTEAMNGMSEDIANLTSKVELQMTPDEVSIQVQTELNNGLEEIKIEGKDFSFNKQGLTIEDINPETNKHLVTTISNNGMIVFADNKDTLVANDNGVKARDLHAVGYLRIGENSRFQDNGNRTVCFWIGGSD